MRNFTIEAFGSAYILFEKVDGGKDQFCSRANHVQPLLDLIPIDNFNLEVK